MRVLIIDDAQLNVTLLQHLVRKLPDCEAVSFTDPVAGLEWCQSNEPDILIVDYMMPTLNGTELVERFRQIPGYADIPVLMVTANNEAEVRHHALQIGVTDFLNKPLDNIEFIARARNMLALRKSHKHLAEEVRKATISLVEHERETIICLSTAAEYRDPETGLHIIRMAHYSRLIAERMGLSEADQNILLDAAPMHDIGKVGIPDMILLKPGKLDEEEFNVMKGHTLNGYQILARSRSPLFKVAAEIAYTHHEKFDGSGYPRGLKGEDIPLFGRIVAVADVFDALTTVRPYKRAWEVGDARKFVSDNSGAHFDPACVEAFLSGWDEVLAIRARFQDEIQE